MTTKRFSDDRIMLFSFIMDNLGRYTCFQYGSDGPRISIEGNKVTICDKEWRSLHTVTIN